MESELDFQVNMWGLKSETESVQQWDDMLESLWEQAWGRLVCRSEYTWALMSENR